MQNIDPIQKAFTSLGHYLQNSPEMLISVDENQFLKLETKYRHLILKFQNSYQSLQKLKVIHESIPQIIHNNPSVQAELKDIEQIKRRLQSTGHKYNTIIQQIQQKQEEKIEAKQELNEMKNQLMIEKRKYMKVRKTIDEKSVQVKPIMGKKYLFSKLALYKKQYQPSPACSSKQLELLVSFHRGIRQIQKKQFSTKKKDVGKVLRNIRIKHNINELFSKKIIKNQKDKENTIEPDDSPLLLSQIKNENCLDPIFKNLRVEGRQGEQNYPIHLQQLSSIELYSKICQSKEKLQSFNIMLRDLLYKHNK